MRFMPEQLGRWRYRGLFSGCTSAVAGTSGRHDLIHALHLGNPFLATN
jgi:hypothetical protein